MALKESNKTSIYKYFKQKQINKYKQLLTQKNKLNLSEFNKEKNFIIFLLKLKLFDLLKAELIEFGPVVLCFNFYEGLNYYIDGLLFLKNLI